MSFQLRRFLTLSFTVLPVALLVLFIIFADFIIANDLLIPMFAIIFVTIILGIASPFIFTRCPSCHMPIMAFSLLGKRKNCPYCKAHLDTENTADKEA